MKIGKILLLGACIGSLFRAVAMDWSVVALTPSLIRLTGDDTRYERARFEKDGLPLVSKLTGWKLDRAMNDAAHKAQQPREEASRLLRQSFSNYWIEATGQSRFPGPTGALLPVRAADVQHTIWIALDAPLADGEHRVFNLPTGERIEWTYRLSEPSPLFKVNQVGYVADARRKYAYLGAWLGTGGAFSLPFPKDGRSVRFQVVDSRTRKVVYEGDVHRRPADPHTKELTPWTGEEVWEMDFSSVTNEGFYYLTVEGIGRSGTFPISADAADAAFRVHMAGLRRQRCGEHCHQTALRGAFSPDDAEYQPAKGRQSGYFDMQGQGLAVNHFRLIAENAGKAKEVVSVPGGWHDAADYDRRPFHLALVDDLVALSLLKPSCPGVLEEAEWGLRHLKVAQEMDGGVGTWIETTRHPRLGEGPTSEKGLVYYLARPTQPSTLAYAASAAALANALRVRGEDSWKTWAASARKAWSYALNPTNRAVSILSYDGRTISYQPSRTLPPDLLFKAGLNLSVLFPNECASYLATLEARTDEINTTLRRGHWKWSPLRFMDVARNEKDVPEFLRPGVEAWNESITKSADSLLEDLETAYPYRTPWYSPKKYQASGMSWGISHPLRRGLFFLAAHALTGLRSYYDALCLCNDFHNGANPRGETLTTGLGWNYPRRYLDLESKYPAGVTPYCWTYGVAREDRELVHADEMVAIWPIWYRFSNIESLTVPSSEFTVWETIGPAVIATGYLSKGVGQ